MKTNEIDVLEDADRRARRYIAGVDTASVFPNSEALAGLGALSGSR